MEFFRQDLHWAFRSMRRNIGLTGIVVLSLALAIGVNTAVFSIVNAFLLRPLGIVDIGRVVRIREVFSNPGEKADVRSVSVNTFLQWKESNRVFDAMAAAVDTSMILTGDGPPERL